MAHNALDQPVLTRRVAPLDQNQQTLIAGDEMTLQQHQLDLQLAQPGFVGRRARI